MDKILDFIVDRSLPKPIKISRASHDDRMSVEDLWSTIWGKVVTKIREEILCNGGLEKDTKYQRRFRNRFRVPFSMFETSVRMLTYSDVRRSAWSSSYLVVYAF